MFGLQVLEWYWRYFISNSLVERLSAGLILNFFEVFLAKYWAVSVKIVYVINSNLCRNKDILRVKRKRVIYIVLGKIFI